jgi:hypothetical protein
MLTRFTPVSLPPCRLAATLPICTSLRLTTATLRYQSREPATTGAGEECARCPKPVGVERESSMVVTRCFAKGRYCDPLRCPDDLCGQIGAE